MEQYIAEAILAGKSEVQAGLFRFFNLPKPQTSGTATQAQTYAKVTARKIAELKPLKGFDVDASRIYG